MKELLESAFEAGIFGDNDVSSNGEFIAFELWYESNKDKIDSAIESYLKEQGKKIVPDDITDVFT